MINSNMVNAGYYTYERANPNKSVFRTPCGLIFWLLFSVFVCITIPLTLYLTWESILFVTPWVVPMFGYFYREPKSRQGVHMTRAPEKFFGFTPSQNAVRQIPQITSGGRTTSQPTYTTYQPLITTAIEEEESHDDEFGGGGGGGGGGVCEEEVSNKPRYVDSDEDEGLDIYGEAGHQIVKEASSFRAKKSSSGRKSGKKSQI